jgi:NADPH:quinone reductase-like Zn-dependent oxidoreductase
VRALTISEHGGTEQLRYREALADPLLASPHDVRVRIRAAALNRLDLFLLRGLPGVSIIPPWVVGSDGAGEVESVGREVTHVSPGDRVLINPGISCRNCEYCLTGDEPLCLRYRILGEHVPGTMADYVVVPAVNVHPMPRDATFEEAAAFPLATLTAWRMCITRAQVREGDDVLIWGIGGGVALAALQICKARGARTWVTSGSDEKLARAQILGADELLNHRTMDVAKEIRAHTAKRGVTVVIDSVGEATWSQSLLALGRRGRLVSCGGTSGPMVQTDVRRLFWNQWTLMGSTMGSESEFAAIVGEYHAGRLRPVVDSVHELADGRAAYERLAGGEQFGKVVVRM